ncbi:hypothetical protein OG777_24180 [Micromonospora peucetia]|uniref:Uncharacterized protein n=1 Tax=Micromonospora peucetia TaxID=47871 RepID=A0A1C6W4U7_9ACTN|nr:hypothetical protein [Micromonospora peucetia]MCX4390006.1 hypothetical protein [Micromonospora peucetia]WSA32690.1 hypothetical protein OIE14_00960 [Micromonospora peucetia]SCL73548.1 hypothetical protein GA0070608_5842 [Micromonospora peucetia]
MPRQRPVAENLPPLPVREKRDQQVKIRLTPSEMERLVVMRPDLTPSGILALLVDDVLAGRYRPAWATAGPDGASRQREA